MRQRLLRFCPTFAALALAACTAQAPQPGASTSSASPAPAAAAPSAPMPARDRLATAVQQAAGAEVLRISSASGTVACVGKDVEITSENARLTLTGACGEVFVIGGNNIVSLESARRVQVSSGKGVQVTGSGRVDAVTLLDGNGRHRFADVGELEVMADGNEVQADSIGTLSLIGHDNRVHWRSGSPTVEDNGSGNVLGPAG